MAMATVRFHCVSALPHPLKHANGPSFSPRTNHFSKIGGRQIPNGSKNAGLRMASRRRSVSLKNTTRFDIGDDLPEDYSEWHPRKDPSERRRAGILLHPTSLPSPHGIGDLGEEAFRFLDWLEATGCSVWQVLPLVPPGRKSGEDGSPYSGQNANCGNTLLISLEELVKDGLLSKEELPNPMLVERINFNLVANVKDPLIAKAAKRLIYSEGELRKELEEFQRAPEIRGWLEDAALFAAIDNTVDAYSWCDWPAPLRDRHLAALEVIYQNQREFIDIFAAQQFLFQRQWQAVHKYAHNKGIKIMGDMPIYVGFHSADVWANRSQFQLNRRTGFPTLVSGVPPDAFSETGQLWGSPLYDWKAMAKEGFSWWIQRMKRAYNLFDEFRIDHFRGLAGYWAVSAESETAMVGTWKVGPREALFEAMNEAVGKIDIIAEDLGVITEDVVQLRKAIGAPGMAVLQFAFGSDSKNPHLPHNHELDQVVYTGTHDNDTIVGWWRSLPQEEKETVMKYLKTSASEISWELIQAAVSSVARTVVIPMQDVLELDSSARMNTPATQVGNWSWRMGKSENFDKLDKETEKLHSLLFLYNRL